MTIRAVSLEARDRLRAAGVGERSAGLDAEVWETPYVPRLRGAVPVFNWV